MNDDNTQEERRTVPTVATILSTGELIELVYDREKRQTGLAAGSGSDVSIKDAIDVGDARLVPWNPENNLIKHEAILLPERPAVGALGRWPLRSDGERGRRDLDVGSTPACRCLHLRFAHVLSAVEE